MDMRDVDLKNPLEVEEVITRFQQALATATSALKGEANVWVYHRKILIELINKHDDDMATLLQNLTTTQEKMRYYKAKTLTLFEQFQKQKKKEVYLNLRLVRATENYAIGDPSIAFNLCPRPRDCEGKGNCCEAKPHSSLDPGCVICQYPECLHCIDIRHRH
jgi:hypothetical protein